MKLKIWGLLLISVCTFLLFAGCIPGTTGYNGDDSSSTGGVGDGGSDEESDNLGRGFEYSINTDKSTNTKYIVIELYKGSHGKLR